MKNSRGRQSTQKMCTQNQQDDHKTNKSNKQGQGLYTTAAALPWTKESNKESIEKIHRLLPTTHINKNAQISSIKGSISIPYANAHTPVYNDDASLSLQPQSWRNTIWCTSCYKISVKETRSAVENDYALLSEFIERKSEYPQKFIGS